MKKFMLILCVIFAELAAVNCVPMGGAEASVRQLHYDGQGNLYDANEINVQEGTLHFISDFCQMLRSREYTKEYTNRQGEDFHWESKLKRYDFKEMESDLAQVGNFKFKEFENIVNYREVEQYLADTVIKPAIQRGVVFVGADGKEFAMIVPQISAIKQEHNASSFIPNSSLFKVSCAATVTGLTMYFAIGLYNKDKTKEQRYSQIKWSLGAAGVIGLGTFLWLR